MFVQTEGWLCGGIFISKENIKSGLSSDAGRMGKVEGKVARGIRLSRVTDPYFEKRSSTDPVFIAGSDPGPVLLSTSRSKSPLKRSENIVSSTI